MRNDELLSLSVQGNRSYMIYTAYRKFKRQIPSNLIPLLFSPKELFTFEFILSLNISVDLANTLI